MDYIKLNGPAIEIGYPKSISFSNGWFQCFATAKGFDMGIQPTETESERSELIGENEDEIELWRKEPHTEAKHLILDGYLKAWLVVCRIFCNLHGPAIPPFIPYP